MNNDMKIINIIIIVTFILYLILFGPGFWHKFNYPRYLKAAKKQFEEEYIDQVQDVLREDLKDADLIVQYDDPEYEKGSFNERVDFTYSVKSKEIDQCYDADNPKEMFEFIKKIYVEVVQSFDPNMSVEGIHKGAFKFYFVSTVCDCKVVSSNHNYFYTYDALYVDGQKVYSDLEDQKSNSESGDSASSGSDGSSASKDSSSGKGSSSNSSSKKKSNSSSQSSRSSSSGGGSSKGDPYNAKDYSDYEDFYEDNYDSFEGIDDAEDYWDDHQD